MSQINENFIMQNQDSINEIFKKKVLEHSESAKIACYMISNGEMNPEQQQIADDLYFESISDFYKKNSELE